MFSKLIRRTHMYLALFLAPWILMYALSTMAMNHRKTLQGWFGEGPPPFEKDREVDIGAGVDSPKRLLEALGMDGMHGLPKAGPGKLVVVRQQAASPVRITYTPASGKAVIERQRSSFHIFLERMHRRKGYQHPYGTDQAWAFSVDLVVVVIVFWVLSGLWMWWELKAARALGALSAVAGLGLFAWLVSVL
ncbi:MAG: hypothetical protein JJE04_03325 [Acidobacteriia bacterium]|nr:hypothetical protein [Terriglobia bacterium]